MGPARRDGAGLDPAASASWLGHIFGLDVLRTGQDPSRLAPLLSQLLNILAEWTRAPRQRLSSAA
jgi:hypothetical protein